MLADLCSPGTTSLRTWSWSCGSGKSPSTASHPAHRLESAPALLPSPAYGLAGTPWFESQAGYFLLHSTRVWHRGSGAFACVLCSFKGPNPTKLLAVRATCFPAHSCRVPVEPDQPFTHSASFKALPTLFRYTAGISWLPDRMPYSSASSCTVNSTAISPSLSCGQLK